MYKRIFISALLLAAAGLAAAQAYRWVDENGVVHYSDRPREGAEEIVLPRDTRPSTPVPPVRSPASSGSGPADAAAEETEGYESLEIASPAAEETLWNIGGTLNVSLDLQPALKQGHRVRVYFDGEPRTVSGTSFQIDEVWRGVHNIQAEILDANGQMLIRSRTNRFYVQQTSVQPGTPGNVNPR
ncbi:MAG: DUF4124 domain-containing protein [Woeseiaceae bacterium]|nr:DUF4124 domain-containing protein [Woeseiaceae bacterium]